MSTNTLRIGIFHCGALHYIRAFWDRFVQELPEVEIHRAIISAYDNEEGFLQEGYDAVLRYPHGKSFNIDETPDSFFETINRERFDLLVYYCDKQLPYPQSNLIDFIRRFEAKEYVAFNTHRHQRYDRDELQGLLKNADVRPTEDVPWPRAVAICTSDLCTADCTFCCLKTQGVQPHNTRLDFDDFTRVYPPLLEKVSHIDFSLGELFVHPKAGDYLDYVFSNYPDKKMSIYSNAINLQPNYIEKIMAAEQAFEIDISINATTRETYAEIMGVDAFDRAMENIATFCRRREELGVKDKKRIVLSYLINNQTLEEFPAIVDAVEKLGIDSVIPRIMKIYDRDSYRHSVYFNQQRYNEVMQRTEAECARRGLNFSKVPLFGQKLRLTPLDRSKGHRIGCDSPWAMVYIRTNGDVSLCANWNFHIGNLYEDSFANIWNGPKAQQVREAIVRGDNPRECWACEVNLAEDDWIDSLAYHYVWGFQEHLMGVKFDADYGYDEKGDFLA